MPEATPLDRWRHIADLLADAQTAARRAVNIQLSADTRSDAARRNARCAAQILGELAELRRAGVLDDIADFLAGRQGPVD